MEAGVRFPGFRFNVFYTLNNRHLFINKYVSLARSRYADTVQPPYPVWTSR
jgi:hypothetical protein